MKTIKFLDFIVAFSAIIVAIIATYILILWGLENFKTSYNITHKYRVIHNGKKYIVQREAITKYLWFYKKIEFLNYEYFSNETEALEYIVDKEQENNPTIIYQTK